MLERLGRFLSDNAADLGRAGQRHCAHLGMLDHRGADFAAEPGDDVHHARGNAGVMQRLHEVENREWRVLRGLDDGGVAGNQRGKQLPRRDRHREVPRRNHGAHAQRLADGHSELVGQLRGDGWPKQPAAFTSGVVTAVDGFLYVAPRLLDDFAHLTGHVACVVFLPCDEELRGFVEHLGTTWGRHETPLLERLTGSLDGMVYVFPGRLLEDADDLTGVGGVEVLKGAASVGFNPLAGDEVLEDLGLGAGNDACRSLFGSSHRIASTANCKLLMLSGGWQVVILPRVTERKRVSGQPRQRRFPVMLRALATPRLSTTGPQE